MKRRSMPLFFFPVLLVMFSLACNLQTRAGGNEATLPTITNLTVSNQTVYYNEQGCGPSTVTLSLSVNGDSGQIQAVGLQYQIISNTAGSQVSGDWQQAGFVPIGNGLFTVTLDISRHANARLNGQDGVLVYQVYVVDAAGNVQTEPANNVASLPVKACVRGQASSGNAPVAGGSIVPPSPPAKGNPGAGGTTNKPGSNSPPVQSGNNNPPSQGNANPPAQSGNTSPSIGVLNPPSQPPASQSLTISNVQVNPSTVYYGACVGGEPTSLQVQATLDPLDQVQSATVRYGFIPQVNMFPQTEYTASMYQLGIGDYAADIDAAATFAGQSLGDGYLLFVVEATDKQGQTITSNSVMADLRECTLQVYTPPTINYFKGPDKVQEGGAVYLQWDVSDANCGVFLDGTQVNASGDDQYIVISGIAPTTLTHTLTARGGDCNNPTEVSQTVQILVEVANPYYTDVVVMYNGDSVDLDGMGGDDIVYAYDSSSEDQLFGVWGTTLSVWRDTNMPNASSCATHVNANGSSSVEIASADYVCYKTGDGNYGYIEIMELYFSLDQNAKILKIYFETLLP